MSAMPAVPAADELGFDELDVGEMEAGQPGVGRPAAKGLGLTAQLADATVAIDARLSAAAALTVLVVEPSRVQASIIKGYLQEHGLNVEELPASRISFRSGASLRRCVVVSSMYLSDAQRPGIGAVRFVARFRSESPAFVLVTTEGNEAESRRRWPKSVALPC